MNSPAPAGRHRRRARLESPRWAGFFGVPFYRDATPRRWGARAACRDLLLPKRATGGLLRLNLKSKAAILTPRQSLIYFAKLLAITAAIAVAALLGGSWALRPYWDSHVFFHDGPPVYSFGFVQPGWLSNQGAWPLAETIVRSAVLGHVVLVFVACCIRKRLRTRQSRHETV